jgi:hypothetical protein
MTLLRNYLLLLVAVSLTYSGSYAQWSGLPTADCFLKGSQTEVGLSPCGTFGTIAAPPRGSGYHNNASLPGLGFVADPGRNGWSTAGPAFLPNYCGDYFMPGYPIEGFSIQLGSSSTILSNNNYSTICERIGIPGAIIDYRVSAGRKTGTWQATVASGVLRGLEITKTTYVPDSGAFHSTKVQLCNHTDSTLHDVYFMQHVDPDNDQRWLGGSYVTTNTVVAQLAYGSPYSLVTATGNTGCYLGLGSRDAILMMYGMRLPLMKTLSALLLH